MFGIEQGEWSARGKNLSNERLVYLANQMTVQSLYVHFYNSMIDHDQGE